MQSIALHKKKTFSKSCSGRWLEPRGVAGAADLEVCAGPVRGGCLRWQQQQQMSYMLTGVDRRDAHPTVQ